MQSLLPKPSMFFSCHPPSHVWFVLGLTLGYMEWVGTGRTASSVSPHPPRCHRACGFHRTRRPHERTFQGSGCSADIGEDAHAFTFSRITTHPPLKLWSFPLSAAFPRAEYSDHADSYPAHQRISALFPALLLPLSFTSLARSPTFTMIDSTGSCRRRLSLGPIPATAGSSADTG